MTWTRLESRYPQSRKVKPLSDGAFRADVEGICWSNDEGTDGRISGEDLELIGDGKRRPKHAAELVRRGRWHAAGDPPCQSDKCPHDGTAPDGWVIHDFHDQQPTAADVKRERELKAERNRRYMEKARRRRHPPNGASSGTSQDATYDKPQTRPKSQHRSAPPRSEGSGGGAPPSGPSGPEQPPPASSAGGAAGGWNDHQPDGWPTDDPDAIAAEVAAMDAAKRADREQLAASTRRGAAAVRAAIRRPAAADSGRAPGTALAELRDATPDVDLPDTEPEPDRED